MEWKWWRALPPSIRTVIASIVAFFTTIAAFSAAYPTMEPWIPAHRQWVRDYSDGEIAKMRRTVEPLKSGLYDIQIEALRTRRAAIDDQVFSLEIEAPKSDGADELLKRRQQIQKLKDERADISERMKDLSVQREKN